MKKDREFHTYRGYLEIRKDKMKLTPSMEDYLEMIYRNCLKNGYVRMTNLAEQLNVQAPSATKIVQKLAKMGLVNYEKYGIIQMTKKGENIGGFLLKRHKIIETFLKNLGVENNILNETEMIEHYLSLSTVKSIDLLNKFFEQNPEILAKYKKFTKKFTLD